MFLRLCIIFCLCAGPLRADAPIVVFAAASLAGPLDAVAEDWDGEVVISYAGSATLARQIEAGAPADVVLLANEAWMAHLVDAGAVSPPSVQPILSNRLVLVSREGVAVASTIEQALSELAPGVRLATGFTEAVPVGIYARQTLENLNQWEIIAPRLVQVENARLALALAARGEVFGAFVYVTDAQAEPEVTDIARIDPALHDPIRYMAARTTGANARETAEFLAHLTGPAAQAIFADAGFETLP